jgi:hypothetical protein
VLEPQALRGALGWGLGVELVVEDGFDGAVGSRADVQRPAARGFHPIPTEGVHEPDNPKAGPEPLLGMRAFFQDQRTQGGGRRVIRPAIKGLDE